jgi:hypothetical protein
VLRLIRERKRVLVFITPDKRFMELAGPEQWDSFIAPFSTDLRNESERKAALEEQSHKDRGRPRLHFPTPVQ